jgi:Ribonuclease G/E
MSKELFIASSPHETKVAVLEDDLLVEVYYERDTDVGLVGGIYKGRVNRVLPGMQSAFVDIGLERDAFLYVSDFFLEDQEEYDKVFEEAEARATRFTAEQAQATESTSAPPASPQGEVGAAPAAAPPVVPATGLTAGIAPPSPAAHEIVPAAPAFEAVPAAPMAPTVAESKPVTPSGPPTIDVQSVRKIAAGGVAAAAEVSVIASSATASLVIASLASAGLRSASLFPGRKTLRRAPSRFCRANHWRNTVTSVPPIPHLPRGLFPQAKLAPRKPARRLRKRPSAVHRPL